MSDRDRDLRVDTYTNGAGEWSVRVTNLRTGRVLHGAGRGEAARNQTRETLCRQALQSEEILWEMSDGTVKLLPREQWPYEPRYLGTITAIDKPSTD